MHPFQMAIRDGFRADSSSGQKNPIELPPCALDELDVFVYGRVFVGELLLQKRFPL